MICVCMITTGAFSVSNMIMVNHSLQELYIGGNNFGDDGINAIARQLGNCKINVLNVTECEITVTGARSLATALLSHPTIRELYLYGNYITVEGAQQILEAAVSNTVTQYVSIGDEYKKGSCKVWKMLFILANRREHEARHCYVI